MLKSLAQLPSVGSEERNLTTTGRLAETRQALVRNAGYDFIASIGCLASRLLIPLFVLARVGLSARSLLSAIFRIVSYVGSAVLVSQPLIDWFVLASDQRRWFRQIFHRLWIRWKSYGRRLLNLALARFEQSQPIGS